jgi:hypothetical protein
VFLPRPRLPPVTRAMVGVVIEGSMLPPGGSNEIGGRILLSVGGWINVQYSTYLFV